MLWKVFCVMLFIKVFEDLKELHKTQLSPLLPPDLELWLYLKVSTLLTKRQLWNENFPFQMVYLTRVLPCEIPFNSLGSQPCHQPLVVAQTNPKEDFTSCFFQIALLDSSVVQLLVCLNKIISHITIIKVALQLWVWLNKIMSCHKFRR